MKANKANQTNHIEFTQTNLITTKPINTTKAKETKPNLPTQIYPNKPNNKTYHAKLQKQVYPIQSTEPGHIRLNKHTRATFGITQK